jgi:hypothetical protein
MIEQNRIRIHAIGRNFALTFLPIGLLLISSAATAFGADPIVIDFEDENYDVWTFVDEATENLGDVGPSDWNIFESTLGFDGIVLTQTSNIWGEPEDHMLMGTIAYYNVQQFENFRLDVDVAVNDNDGMGLVWGYQDLDKHYRFQMMNDRWPELPPIDGYNGPYLISHKRVSNSSPWYDVMEVLESDEYIPYTVGFELFNHWTLEVVDGAFTITTTDFDGNENVLSGFDDEFKSGYVGIQLYAQGGVEFDNFTITPLDASVPGDFDGSGSLDAPDIDDLTAQSAGGTNNLAYDLNSDTLVNSSDVDVWIKDLFNSWIGDADLDGQFNSSDLVQVLASGTYEVDTAAVWSTGDFNGDGRTDSSDLVSALSDGGYEVGPRTAVQAVPEPSAGLLACLAFGWMASRMAVLRRVRL